MSDEDNDVLDLDLSSGDAGSVAGSHGERSVKLAAAQDEEEGAVGASAEYGVFCAPTDDELRFMEDKSDVRRYGRDVYKRWKKLRRRLGRATGGGDGVLNGKEKRKKSKRRAGKADAGSELNTHDVSNVGVSKGTDEEDEAAPSSSRRRQRRSRREEPPEDAELAESYPEGPVNDVDAVGKVRRDLKRRKRGGEATEKINQLGSAGAGTSKTKKLSAEAQRDLLNDSSIELVEAMRHSRLADERDMAEGRPPLNRVGLRERVERCARSSAFHRYLIENGILQELSTWLYDFDRRELGAYELRTAALDILLEFPIEGEISPTVTRNGDEVIDDFIGITRDHLYPTSLGSAVNALRESRNETHENRSKAVRLLQRLSRAMSGGVHQGDRRVWSMSSAASRNGEGRSVNSKKVLSWKCQGDPDVAPPFHIVQTGTEVFQRALAQPDPLDPLSYLRVPPWRAPKPKVADAKRGE